MAHIEGPDQVDGALHKLVLKSLDDDLAQEIVTINLAGKSALADHMVVATGRSQRHVGAVADHLLRKLKEDGHKSVRAEGLSTCDWVLVDAGDVVVHIFRAEVREFYGIEKMWAAEASPVPSGSPASVADRQLGAELSA
jgi:ribosome-associated protein